MLERPGPSFVFSFLLVMAAAAVLNRPDPPPRLVQPAPKTEADSIDTAPEPPRPASSAKPPVPPADASPRTDATPGPIGDATDRTHDRPGEAPAAGRTPREPATLRRPEAGFTTVFEGERIADVALRVYGRRDAAEGLWRANRDAANALDTDLHVGTLLRTPDLRPAGDQRPPDAPSVAARPHRRISSNWPVSSNEPTPTRP